VARRFDAVIFDMDGVLVDSESMHREVTRALLNAYGVPHPDEESAEFLGIRTKDMFPILCERHRLTQSSDALTRECTERTVRRIVDGGVTPMPGVPAIPRQLASERYPLAVASSSEPEVIQAVLHALGIRDLFGAVVSAEEVPNGKPAPDVFLEAARRLGRAAARCLVIEDSAAGVRAAKAAAMTCVAIPCAETAHLDFSAADHRLATMKDLPRLL
jgi:HAD superfamily hydrolase (TIGR01509 family)